MHSYQVLIIGSGFGGQCAAVNLLKAGMASFRAIMLAVNIAMYANPIGLIIAGIVLFGMPRAG